MKINKANLDDIKKKKKISSDDLLELTLNFSILNFELKNKAFRLN